MKKLFCLIIICSVSVILRAQMENTIYLDTAGTLGSRLSSDDKNYIYKLIVTGTIDARDFKTMRDEMPHLSQIDLSGANISAYNGINGTYLWGSYSYSANEIPPYAFYNKSECTAIKLPNSTKSIGFYSFDNCKTLNGITIPSSVTVIDDFAFNNCIRIDTLLIPGSITKIDDCFLSGCFGLKHLIIKNPIPLTLSSKTFYNFNQVSCSLEVPSGSLYLYQNADYWKQFSSITEAVSSLTAKNINVTTAGALSSLLTRDEKSTITNLTLTGIIDARDFKTLRDELNALECLNMKNVTIEAYTGSDGPSDSLLVYTANGIPGHSFNYNYTSIGKPTLKSIILPNQITSIGYIAFYGCNGLTSIVIPSLVTNIGRLAFGGCESLTQIYSCATTPARLDSYDDFYEVDKSKCTLFVPTGTKGIYQTFIGWKDFVNIVETDMTEPGSSTAFDLKLTIKSEGVVHTDNLIIPSDSIIKIKQGATKTFIITPNTGYEIDSLLYNGADVRSQLSNNQYTTPAIESNVTLRVTFKKSQYRISLKSADNGTVNLLCEYGATPSFDFTALNGWQVHAVFYNGNEVTNDLREGIYTIPSVTGNAILNVSFESSIPTTLRSTTGDQIRIYAISSDIIIEGTNPGDIVALNTIDGVQLRSVQSQGQQIVLHIKPGIVYVVTTPYKSIKIAI